MEKTIIESQFIFPTQVFRAQFDPAQELAKAVVPITRARKER